MKRKNKGTLYFSMEQIIRFLHIYHYISFSAYQSSPIENKISAMNKSTPSAEILATAKGDIERLLFMEVLTKGDMLHHRIYRLRECFHWRNIQREPSAPFTEIV